jgi:energy-coupling factor transporter ATP-binding protein EcfA2
MPKRKKTFMPKRKTASGCKRSKPLKKPKEHKDDNKQGKEKSTEAEPEKVVVLIGQTGTGKSRLVELLSGETIQFISSDELVSFTTETTPYVVPELGVKIYDTPGLGDTEQRDMTFCETLVNVLMKETGGIHRVYIVLDGSSNRFDETAKDCLLAAIALFDCVFPYKEFHGASSHLGQGVKIVFTHWDNVEPERESLCLDEWIKELSDHLRTISRGDVICTESRSPFAAGVSALKEDLKQIQTHQVLQSLDMKKLDAAKKKLGRAVSALVTEFSSPPEEEDWKAQFHLAQKEIDHLKADLALFKLKDELSQKLKYTTLRAVDRALH